MAQEIIPKETPETGLQAGEENQPNRFLLISVREILPFNCLPVPPFFLLLHTSLHKLSIAPGVTAQPVEAGGRLQRGAV